MRKHYNIDNLRRAVSNPVLIAREILRLTSLPFHKGYGYYLDKQYGNGIDVMAQDWDNLIILDACRYDSVKSQNGIDGELEAVVSAGNRSWEFMQANFTGKQFHDTVYVTANPYANRLDDDVFHAVDLLLDRWDDEIGTVQPQDVVEAAIEAHETYPNKRLIVHFMQPHRPYLGPTADELRERVDLIGYRNQGDGLQIWGAAKERKVTVSEIRRAYSESLDIVLDHVSELLEQIDGKSIITSDHGEMLGERVFPFTSRVWGHSEGFTTPQLRTVPWLVVPGNERRNISAEGSTESESLEEDVVQERLQALGYHEE